MMYAHLIVVLTTFTLALLSGARGAFADVSTHSAAAAASTRSAAADADPRGAAADASARSAAADADPRSAAADASSRRVAVLVGANSAPAGRRELRFAQADAQRVAETLQLAGRFAPADVHVLLDPSPAALLALLGQVAAQLDARADNLLVFYYSGHSDGQALYPHGETLALADVRERLLRIRARVRVGILDTCRGGSWTQAKDLSLGPPLPAADLAALSSEGNVLVAASAGFEDAHEAEAVGGSFFTHHLSAGLSGAADRSGDGDITVQEAYEYARERTVRDSARYAPVPQHPSFSIDLRGRQDVVLTTLQSHSNALELVQTDGPLEVIQLASGRTVAETTRGAQRARLVLPTGRYLIRRLASDRIYSKQVDLNAGGVTTLREAALEASDAGALAMKGFAETPPPYDLSSSLPAGYWRLTFALGMAIDPIWQGPETYESNAVLDEPVVRSLDFTLALSHAFTDRLTMNLPLPAFSYRFGNEGCFEALPRLGIIGLGYSSLEGLLMVGDAGVSVRAWTAENQSMIATVAGMATYSFPTEDDHPATRNRVWTLGASAGYGWTIRNTVSIYPGIGIQHGTRNGSRRLMVEQLTGSTLRLGSVLMLGYRALPLMQLHLSRAFALDLWASVGIELETGDLYDKYLLGFTWDF